MSDKLIRWSSGLLILSGILIAGPMLFHPDTTEPGYALTQAWVPVHVLLAIGALAGAAGFGVFYRAMGSRLSVYGHAAFILALLGYTLVAGMSLFVQATIVPVLAANPVYQTLLSVTGPLMAGAFGNVATLSIVILSAGVLFLAGYLVWTKTISVFNGILFIGAPLAGFAPPFLAMLGIIGGVMFGAAITWLGVSIRSGIAHEALASGLRAYDECLVQAGGHA
jgi:hypothetical protein